MRVRWLRVFILAAVGISGGAGQQPKSSPKGEASVVGIFVGRSGKPMANARLFLGRIEDDQEVLQAKIKLGGLPIAQTDAKGQFKFTGVAPGAYTVVYFPAGGSSFAPAEISIKALQAVTRSILPLMKGVEIGTSEPMDERKWGAVFTLLKGHTFWGEGANMKVWNATMKRGAAGPYLEVRKGLIWQADFNDKAQVKMTAWSF
jgi:hypothetical protein